jgi:small subunit ribosomal protein S20
MPNTESAKKRLRQNVVARDRNRSAKSEIRTYIRKVRESAAAGNVEEAEVAYKEVARKLDRAASQNVMHGNQAARLKSRLQKRIKAAKAAA